MENTCIETCRYRDKKEKYKKTCPDYMEISWTSDTGEVKSTEDCAKRRTLLMIMNFDQRLIGVQKSSEQERNSNHVVAEKLTTIINIAAEQHLIDDKIQNLIEDN